MPVSASHGRGNRPASASAAPPCMAPSAGMARRRARTAPRARKARRGHGNACRPRPALYGPFLSVMGPCGPRRPGPGWRVGSPVRLVRPPEAPVERPTAPFRPSPAWEGPSGPSCPPAPAAASCRGRPAPGRPMPKGPPAPPAGGGVYPRYRLSQISGLKFLFRGIFGPDIRAMGNGWRPSWGSVGKRLASVDSCSGLGICRALLVGRMGKCPTGVR